jgi:hypothetical protein
MLEEAPCERSSTARRLLQAAHRSLRWWKTPAVEPRSQEQNAHMANRGPAPAHSRRSPDASASNQPIPTELLEPKLEVKTKQSSVDLEYLTDDHDPG